MEPTQSQWVSIHPLIVRITHWINALAILVMVTSGWRIYNASPLFPFRIPSEITLGGWLAGALQWHFAAMWLLVINGIVYVTYGIASGHFRRKFFPVTPGAVLRDVKDALRGKLAQSTAPGHSGSGAPRREGRAARQARARGPVDVQRGAARRLPRDPRVPRGPGVLGAGDLEAGAVLRDRQAHGGLRGRAHRALFRDGTDGVHRARPDRKSVV